MSVPTITLNDGVPIPQLGFGTWKVPANAVSYTHLTLPTIYSV